MHSDDKSQIYAILRCRGCDALVKVPAEQDWKAASEDVCALCGVSDWLPIDEHLRTAARLAFRDGFDPEMIVAVIEDELSELVNGPRRERPFAAFPCPNCGFWRVCWRARDWREMVNTRCPRCYWFRGKVRR